MSSQNFDDVARNLAEAIDDVLTTERERPRRLALIQRQVRRAMAIAYRAARGFKGAGEDRQ